MRRRACLLLLLGLLTPGCASFVSAQRPVVQAEDKGQVTAAPAFFQGYGTVAATPPAGVNLVVAGRYGLGDGWELGGRVWGVGGALEVNYQLVAEGPHHLLVGGRLIGQLSDQQLLLEAAAPLLYGLKVGHLELVGGLEARIQYWPAASALQTVFTPGAILGVAFVGDGGWFIMPEVSFHAWPPGATWFYQATVSVGF